MDVTLLSPNSVRIKGKTVSFIVEPRDTKGKLTADAVITFDTTPIDISGIEGARVTLAGAGDYEVGGVKMAGVKNNEASLYYINLDSMMLMVGKASTLKSKEVVRDADIAVIFADSPVDTSLLATLNPRTVIFYGPQSQENIKLLGKETSASTKYSVTKDKLPAELEALLLQL